MKAIEFLEITKHCEIKARLGDEHFIIALSADGYWPYGIGFGNGYIDSIRRPGRAKKIYNKYEQEILDYVSANKHLIYIYGRQ